MALARERAAADFATELQLQQLQRGLAVLHRLARLRARARARVRVRVRGMIRATIPLTLNPNPNHTRATVMG